MKGKKKAKSQAILEALLTEQMQHKPIYLTELPSEIWRFSKKYGFDPNKVADIVNCIVYKEIIRVFDQDFSKKPKRFHHGSH